MTHASDDRAAQSPEELRRRAEQTRHELGRTLQALAARTDVRARLRARATAVRAAAGARASRAGRALRRRPGGPAAARPGGRVPRVALPAAAGLAGALVVRRVRRGRK
jgi:hypothetical protein